MAKNINKVDIDSTCCETDYLLASVNGKLRRVNVATFLDKMNIPTYAYGTEDLNAGTSELKTGKLYFVYE